MIAVFYSLATGWHHQISLLDAGEVPRNASPGEAILQIEQKLFDAWLAKWGGAGDPIQDYVNERTGMKPAPCEYAVVKDGVVVNVIGRADPALGHLDAVDKTAAIVKSDLAVPGATYDGQVFTKPAEAVIVKNGN